MIKSSLNLWKLRNIKIILLLLALFMISCIQENLSSKTCNVQKMKSKYVVYQVFTRLFGNTLTVNRPWGTKDEKGIGKFVDLDDSALVAIQELGVTHNWFCIMR